MALVADCGTGEGLQDLLSDNTIVDVVKSQAALLEQIAQRVGNSMARQLLIQCLSIDPYGRPSATQIGTELTVRTCTEMYIRLVTVSCRDHGHEVFVSCPKRLRCDIVRICAGAARRFIGSVLRMDLSFSDRSLCCFC